MAAGERQFQVLHYSIQPGQAVDVGYKYRIDVASGPQDEWKTNSATLPWSDFTAAQQNALTQIAQGLGNKVKAIVPILANAIEV